MEEPAWQMGAESSRNETATAETLGSTCPPSGSTTSEAPPRGAAQAQHCLGAAGMGDRAVQATSEAPHSSCRPPAHRSAGS